MHKTGTTALQKFFCLNQAVLAENGVWYPQAGRGRNTLAHHDIANSLKGPPFPLRAPAKSDREYLQEIQDCFNAFPEVLLSSEIFMRFVPAFKDHLSLDLPMLDKLRLTADVVKVIIYLRRQDEYLESFYAQEIQHGLDTSFSDFVSQRTPDYFQLCTQLAGYFGKSNVTVRVYDSKQFSRGSIFSDFLSVLDIELTDSFTIPAEDVNRSLMPEEREFSMLINALDLSLDERLRFNEPLLKLSQKRRAVRGRGETATALFSAFERAALLRECSAANRRVATEFLGREGPGDLLFQADPEGITPATEVYSGLGKEALVDIIGYLQSSYPELFRLLSAGIERGLLSRDTAARKVARKLREVM